MQRLKPPLATTRRLDQCVLLAPFDALFFYQNTGQAVWLDNLLLRSDRASGIASTLVRRPMPPRKTPNM